MVVVQLLSRVWLFVTPWTAACLASLSFTSYWSFAQSRVRYGVSFFHLFPHICAREDLPAKVYLVKAMVFPVVMYGCESWTVKKAEHWRTDAFEVWCWEKTLESPLDCKEIQPVHSEGDQPWVFLGRNDAEAEAPVLWPPPEKSWLIGKDSDAGRDWGQEEKGTIEDEMAGWHHGLDGHESEWTLGVGDGQGGLACCDSWGRKESDTTERLNWTELNRKAISRKI